MPKRQTEVTVLEEFSDESYRLGYNADLDEAHRECDAEASFDGYDVDRGGSQKGQTIRGLSGDS